MKDYINNYMEIISNKYELRKKTRPEGNNIELYLNGINDEVEEVKLENKNNNSVYLEDELGDILRDYLNVLFYFQKDGKIESWESVFKKSYKKFKERVDGQYKKIPWEEVKQKQKIELKEQHIIKYGNNS